MALACATLLSAMARLCMGHMSLLGNFSSYQNIFGMIAERYAFHHCQNVFMPELFMIESGKPALELIFFPLVSLFAAAFQLGLGGNMDCWGRFISVLATSLNMLLIYRLARHRWDRAVAVLASIIFACSPYVWVYGRNFQNEALALLLFSLSLYGILRSRKGRNVLMWLLLSSISLGCAGILRVHFLFALPALWLFFTGPAHALPRKLLWLTLALSLSFLWNAHAWDVQNRLPNVHSTMFMQMAVGKTFPHPLLLHPAYYMHFLKNLAGWAAGPVAFCFALLAMAHTNTRRETWPWTALCVFAFASSLLIPQKFMAQHFYGYMASLPMSILAAIGIRQYASKVHARLWPALAGVLASSLMVAWRPAYTLSAQDLAVAPAARFIRQNIPAQDWIIASHGTSGDLLYYGHRLGWTFFLTPHENRPVSVYMHIAPRGGPSPEQIQERNKAYSNSIDWLEYLRKQGARYFVVSERCALDANPALRDYLMLHYTESSSPRDPFAAYQLTSRRPA